MSTPIARALVSAEIAEVLTWVGRTLPLGAEQLLRLKAARSVTPYRVLVRDEDIYVMV